jgi:phosphonate degradation associated HDIG domain protein
MTPASLDDVLQTFRDYGHRLYGEEVTELQHALQCAALAQAAGESSTVIVAALLHDFGHLCHALGEDIADREVDARHEYIGYEKLKGLFTDEIVAACRLHVAAKRYLCWKEPEYLQGLTPASQKSLRIQGGPMNQAEAEVFEREPHFALALRVRRYDDKGKVRGMTTPDLDSFLPLMQTLVRTDA